MQNSSFMVKVTDAKMADVQKALEQAGIKVRSIVEVFKEEVAAAEQVGTRRE